MQAGFIVPASPQFSSPPYHLFGIYQTLWASLPNCSLSLNASLHPNNLPFFQTFSYHAIWLFKMVSWFSISIRIKNLSDLTFFSHWFFIVTPHSSQANFPGCVSIKHQTYFCVCCALASTWPPIFCFFKMWGIQLEHKMCVCMIKFIIENSLRKFKDF